MEFNARKGKNMLNVFIKLFFLLFFAFGQFFIIQDFLQDKNYTCVKSIVASIWIFMSMNIPIIFNAYFVLKTGQPIPIITLSVTVLELGICLFGIIGIYNFIRRNYTKKFY